MQENHGLRLLLDKAKELEKRYDWLGAIEFYNKGYNLSLKEKDFFKSAEFCEFTGYCFFKAALQANTNSQFKKIIKLAVQNYERATSLFQNSNDKSGITKANAAKAMIAYASSLLEADLSKRKELFDEYWKLEKQVLKYYEKMGDRLAVGRICNDLADKNSDRYHIESTWEGLKSSVEEGLSYGEKAILMLSEVNDDYELARAYLLTSLYYSWAVWFRVTEESWEEFRQKAITYSEKALVLSEKTGDSCLIAQANSTASTVAWFCKDDLVSALEFSEKAQKHSKITKDNRLLANNTFGIGLTTFPLTLMEEDPDKQREGFHKAAKLTQDAIHHFHIIADHPRSLEAYRVKVESITWLASIEANLETKRAILMNAIAAGKEGLKISEASVGIVSRNPLQALSIALYDLSKLETKLSKKRQLLKEALKHRKKVIKILQQVAPLSYFLNSRAQNYQALIQAELARIETNKAKKIELLNAAVSTMEKCLKLMAKEREQPKGWISGWAGRYHYWFGGILNQLYLLTKDKENLLRAIEVYKVSAEIFQKAELMTHTAETHWQIAKMYARLGKHTQAACNYESAAKSYKLAGERIPQLKDFYHDYSLYMQAWSEIEKARYNHSIEEYDKAKQHYEEAANLHESSEPWSYLAPNYFAWASVEEAERLSRKENTKQAKQVFQKALEQFSKAEKSIKNKVSEITSIDEKEMTLRLFKASDLRRRFCQARILLEDAKLLDREGKYLQSSKSYGEAAQNISAIVEKIDTEAERKELKLLATLCQAWEKMAIAEETTSSESYLEAATLFEQAKEHCYTKKVSLWTLGNSNFCKGLAAGTRYQGSMDLKENALAKRYIKSAASYYLQAGFKSASEYAKATQRLFDAYVFMNQAESEVSPENKAKQYQMAENLLQISAVSFMRAKQPEKTAQVQGILATVREEKALAVSLNEVMHAPTITSSTFSFAAPSPTSEASVGLEQFQHANVQANLIAGMKEVKVGESFCLTVEFVNAGKEPALLTRVEDFVPPDFIVVKKPEIYRLEESCLNMKGKQIAPLKLVEAKLVLQPSKKGVYHLKPTVHYLDELGQNKTLQLKSVEIKVEEVVLADRVPTGTRELDSLLLGGIPREYAVVLTGSPSDERELIIRNFLEAGTGEGQTSFYVTTEAVGLENLLKMPGFYLFLCNPKPKVDVSDLPNVFKMRSKTDLTNLSISLEKAQRALDPSCKRRVCLELVSDVLLRHGAEVTRRWVSELITDMGSKGFTVLAVLNPAMHPPDQATAVVDLFDGEISLYQTDDPLECKKSIRVKKLRNQDYIKNPICLTKPK